MTAPGLISGRAAVNLIVLCVLLIAVGISASRAARPTSQSTLTGPTTVKRVNGQVIELSWNGGPKNGYVLSETLNMKVGDRIELFWLGGCLRPIPQEQCFKPWGAFDVDPENRGLFRYNRWAYAVYIVHGAKREAWDRGSDRMLITVADLPVKLFFNTVLEAGVYTTSTTRSRIPLGGYNPPAGKVFFQVVNRH